MTQSLLFDTLISLKSLGHSPAQKFFFVFLGFKSCVWVVTHRILSICLYGCESWCLKETLYKELRQFHAAV